MIQLLQQMQKVNENKENKRKRGEIAGELGKMSPQMLALFAADKRAYQVLL